MAKLTDIRLTALDAVAQLEAIMREVLQSPGGELTELGELKNTLDVILEGIDAYEATFAQVIRRVEQGPSDLSLEYR